MIITYERQVNDSRKSCDGGLRQLAQFQGVLVTYCDVLGRRRVSPPESLLQVLQARGSNRDFGGAQALRLCPAELLWRGQRRELE
ncbi:MAG: hypothetical protein A3H27_14505 [Acidobacteria bacterium RIFCSPLOWO2_02_FULL_59_13]|nr:MAG: hypothetical protein A3H27_14505 [Acidobacteria bacterium RIFCSPLOWO2_02_FULL_59_13]